MPFTLSHAAAVLPLRRTRLPFSALVIGSFGPDFEYFLRMNSGSRAWHYFPDVVVYCLPFSLFTYFVFHAIVRQPAIELLPDSVQARVNPAVEAVPRNMAALFAIIAALSLGILTHLVWDAFTHQYSRPYEHLSFLRDPFITVHGRTLYGYALAQALSSVLGVLFLTVSFWRWYRASAPRKSVFSVFSAKTKFVIWLAVFVASLGGAVWRSLYIWSSLQGWKFGPHPRVVFIIASVGCFLWSLLLYGFGRTLWCKRKEAHR